MNIVELFAHIGVKADQDKADRFLGTVKGIKIGLVSAIAGATAFSVAIKKITDESFAAALEMKKFQMDTGASVESLQKWSAVADQVSGSGKAVAESIRAITSNQEKIKLGQGNISGYQMLGIDPRSDPFQVLEQLRTKTQGLSQAMKKNIISQMGISGDLISTLELTNEQFDAMASKAWIIPQSSIDSMNSARASMTEVGQAVKYMQSLIATKLAPKIVEITQKTLAWVRANKDGIVKGIKTLFDLIVRFGTSIVRVVSMINSLVQNTLGLGNALKIVIGIILAMNAAFLASPMGLFIAGIVLLVAILEDLYVYSKGGKSLFGVFVEKFPVLGKIFESVAGLLKDVLTAIGAILNGDWKKLDDITDKWGVLGDIIDGIVGALRWLMTGFQFPAALSSFLESTKKKGFGEAMKNEWEGALEIWKQQGAGIAEWFSGFFDNKPSMQGAVNTTNAPTINIFGVKDPKEAGKAAAEETQRVLNKTYTNRQKGVSGGAR